MCRQSKRASVSGSHFQNMSLKRGFYQGVEKFMCRSFMISYRLKLCWNRKRKGETIGNQLNKVVKIFLRRTAMELSEKINFFTPGGTQSILVHSAIDFPPFFTTRSTEFYFQNDTKAAAWELEVRVWRPTRRQMWRIF